MESMTIYKIKKWIGAIKEEDGDDEAQHSMEDDLRESVLEAIAGGTDNAQELAKEALKTKKIEFSRWCA